MRIQKLSIYASNVKKNKIIKCGFIQVTIFKIDKDNVKYVTPNAINFI